MEYEIKNSRSEPSCWVSMAAPHYVADSSGAVREAGGVMRFDSWEIAREYMKENYPNVKERE